VQDVTPGLFVVQFSRREVLGFVKEIKRIARERYVYVFTCFCNF
jgi:hypothetical protein